MIGIEKSLRIILVFYQPPVPDSAAGRWGFFLVTRLVKRGHKVAVICLGESRQRSAVEALLPTATFDVTFVCRESGNRTPSILRKIWNSTRMFGDSLPTEFKNAVEERVAMGCDILQVDMLAGGWAAMKFATRALVLHHSVYQADLRLERFRSLRHRLAIWRLLRAEKYLCRRFNNHIAITEQLAEEIRRLHPGASIWVSPLSVDYSSWNFVTDGERGKIHLKICLFTHARWTPGILAVRRLCLKIWPLILAELPTARLQLVGPGMLELIAELGDVQNLEAHDFVESIEPFWQKAGIMLYAPEVGTGIKTKMLEAMAYGIPIVTNEQGAEGLGIVNGVHALIGEEDEILAANAITLLRDVDFQNRLRHAARAHLECKFNEETVLNQLESVYCDQECAVMP